MKKSNKLFVKVKCKSYFKKVNDGIYIQYFNPEGEFYNETTVPNENYKAIAYKRNNDFFGKDEEIDDLSDFCGQSVEKTYFEKVKKDFIGFVVGYTYIKVVGVIGTDWYEEYVDGHMYGEYGYCFKHPLKFEKVAVVYYQNNCKRYVPVEDLEIL